MVMGQSAGRSKGNRTSGPHRTPQRERDLIDPPGRQEWSLTQERLEEQAHEERRERWLEMFAWGLWTFFCVILAVIVCAWWGLL